MSCTPETCIFATGFFFENFFTVHFFKLLDKAKENNISWPCFVFFSPLNSEALSTNKWRPKTSIVPPTPWSLIHVSRETREENIGTHDLLQLTSHFNPLKSAKHSHSSGATHLPLRLQRLSQMGYSQAAPVHPAAQLHATPAKRGVDHTHSSFFS